MHRIELEEEIKKIFKSIKIAPSGNTLEGKYRGIKREKINVSLPLDIIERLNALYGNRSAHVEKALRFYLQFYGRLE